MSHLIVRCPINVPIKKNMIFAGDGICSENYLPPRKNTRCEYQTWISAEKELDWGGAVMSAEAIGMAPLPRAQRRVRR